ncbi:MAG TPA: glycosyltransferase family 2 protein [Candidatus Sulfotelmatobacter sp.]
MRTTVSVIVPIRNEEKYIEACLTSLLAQTYPTELYEILAVDGRSSDRSREIVRRLESAASNVHCLDNPAATAPAGMNIGIRNSKGEVIIRADGHNFYPADYLENCVKCLRETGADNVGGPWRTVPASNAFGARLVAAILASPFGVGDSSFRTTAKEGYVETVPFGAFRRELFDRIGLFNENLVRNQDNELNARIRHAGGRIYQTPALTTEYHPVATFAGLLQQTFRTSQWHVFSMRQNIRAMGLRHLVPAFFVTTFLALSVAWLFAPLAGLSLISLAAIYLLIGLAVSLVKSRQHGISVLCVLPGAFWLFHLSYGLGTLVGLRYLFTSPPTSPIRAGQPVDG